MCFIFGGNGEPPSDTDTISEFFNAESLFSIIEERNESVSALKNYKIQTAINGENTNPVDVQLTLVKSDGSFDAYLYEDINNDVYSIDIRFIPTFKEGYTTEEQTEVKKYEIWWEAQEIEVG